MIGLLVVGAPNHALGMPRLSTRQSAVDQYGADIPDTGTGLHEWLETVRCARRGVPAAVFDTRSGRHPVLARMDHAAGTEQKLLGRLGAQLVASAEHFTVVDTQGPLVDGEASRARRWGTTLADRIGARSPGPGPTPVREPS